MQDGASTDGTLDAIRQYPNPEIALVSEQDFGIYDAINRGIERSTGDIIGLLHSDDAFASERVVESVVRRFSDCPVDAVYGDLQYVSAEDPTKVIRHWRAGSYERSSLERGWMPPHPTLFLRRQIIDYWGLYDTGYRIAADYEAFLRWATRAEITLAYIPEVLVRMRLGGASNQSIRQIVLKSREDFRAIRAHGVGGVKTLVQKNIRKIGQFWRM